MVYLGLTAAVHSSSELLFTVEAAEPENGTVVFSISIVGQEASRSSKTCPKPVFL
jgi:hypothetical protein